MLQSIHTWLAVAIVAAFLWGCSQPTDHPEPIRPVRAIKVGDLKEIGGREFPGRAAAKNEVDLSFQVVGPLVALPVDVGTKVKKDEIIAAIDPRDFETALENMLGNLERAKANLLAMQRGARPEEIEQLKAALVQAEASYEQALAQYERNERLIATESVTREEYDFSRARKKRTAAEIKSAQEALNIGMKGARQEDIDAKQSEIRALEAAVEAARNQLDYATLTAPFDGEVAAKYVNNFQTVHAKQPIVKLLDVSKIEVTVQIPESLIGLVPQVKSVTCRFDAIPDRDFTGIVTKIGREASQITRTYPVTVEVDQPEDVQILPGMAAKVSRNLEDHASETVEDLIVPARSVFTTAGDPQTYVWVVDTTSHKVTRRPVKAGDLTAVGLKVLEGLASGDIVVTSGVNTLREGQEVKLL